MRRALQFAVALTLTGVVLVLGAWFALEPPTLEVPQARAFELPNVTLVTPGAGRRAGETLALRNGRTAARRRPDSTTPFRLPQYAGHYVLPGLLHIPHTLFRLASAAYSRSASQGENPRIWVA